MLSFLFNCLLSLYLLSLPTTLTLHNVCPGHEHQITSSPLLHHPKKQGLAAVNSTGRRGRSSQEKRRSRSRGGERDKGTGRRRRHVSGEGQRLRLQSPMSDQTERLRRARDRRRREKASQSLPRDALRNYDDSDTETRAERGRKRGKGRSRERKSRSEERERMLEREEFMNRDKLMRVGERRKEVVETFESESEDGDREVILPIPSLTQRLPRPKEIWEEESDDDWGMAAEYRELRKEEKPETEWERSWGDDSRKSKDTGLNRCEKEDNDEQSSSVKRPLRSVGVIDPESQRKPFSFLASTLSIDQLGDDESDSEGSHSDGSVSAASISTLSLVTTQPGPWFMPSQQRLTQVMKENRQADRVWGKKKWFLLTFNRKLSNHCNRFCQIHTVRPLLVFCSYPHYQLFFLWVTLIFKVVWSHILCAFLQLVSGC